jgi:diguanylate cyclase (GGDEF)-like protein
VTTLFSRFRGRFSTAAILLAFVAALAAAGYALVNFAVDRLIINNARITAESLANFYLDNIPDFAEVVKGRTPAADSIVFMQQAGSIGRMFRFRFYDAEGRLRVSSDALGRTFTYTDSFADLYPEEAANLAAEQSFAFLARPEAGAPADYTISLVPVMSAGKLDGWLELAMGQERRREIVMSEAVHIALLLTLLIAIGPVLGFWYVTRQKSRVEQTLSFVTNHDQLTKLPNRPVFAAQLEETLVQAERRQEHTAIINIELDRLRELYEQFGRDTVDAVLMEFAARLRAQAGPLGIAARLSDSEFVVLKSSIHDAMEAAQFARAALQALTQPVNVDERSVTVDVNIGLALAPTDGKTASDLMKSADVALLSSKASGRNSYRFFDADTENGLRKRRAIESAVKEACEQKLFELYYQPVFELRTSKLTGFEALIRLNHPQHGAISPAEFIPVSEDLGLIGEIGTWVLETACRMAATWPDPLKVAVNLSPLQFRNGSMIASARRSLEKARFPAYRLELEVTEGVLLDDTAYVQEQLRALQESGVGIVLDDFGAGYSSLGYLWQFPFNKLKIDQSFVRAMDVKHNVRDILRAIIGLARSLSLPVTAEGVETFEQAEYLRSLDCTEAQGYHFGRPVPATDVAAIILRNFADTSGPLDPGGSGNVVRLSAS